MVRLLLSVSLAWMASCVLAYGATVGPDPDPIGPIRPEFTDNNIGVSITRAAGGTLLKDPAIFEAQYVKNWRDFLYTANDSLLLPQPDANWDGSAMPPPATWNCAPDIRAAFNETDDDVKAELIDAIKQYHTLVWSGGEGSPLTTQFQILGILEPLKEPGDEFTEVVIQKIPETGTPLVFLVTLIYD